jgi:hypothetical protein
MIIYGTKAAKLAKEHVMDKCQHCGQSNSIDIYLYQRYAHVFWIPFFPLAKTGISQCSHCQQALKGNEMPDNLRSSYDSMKQQYKTPIWMFAGLAAFAALIVVTSISISNDKKENKLFIEAPKTGDVYEIKTPEGNYSLMRVADVKTDSVFVQMNEYEVNQFKGISKLKSEHGNNYTTETFGYSKSDLKGMLEKGNILDVDR